MMAIFTQRKWMNILFCGTVVLMFITSVSGATTNLTCYQCERHDENECDLNDLKQCSSSFDRCAIMIKKEAEEGLTVTRKCGLAPCGFDDEMMAKGLGMNCDRNMDSYSCVLCCKENGCNKNKAPQKAKCALAIFGLFIVTILNVVRDFITPYVVIEHSKK